MTTVALFRLPASYFYFFTPCASTTGTAATAAATTTTTTTTTYYDDYYDHHCQSCCSQAGGSSSRALLPGHGHTLSVTITVSLSGVFSSSQDDGSSVRIIRLLLIIPLLILTALTLLIFVIVVIQSLDLVPAQCLQTKLSPSGEQRSNLDWLGDLPKSAFSFTID